MLKTLQDVIMDEGDHDILPILNSVYVIKIYINKESNEWNVILNSKLHIPEDKIEIIRKKIVDKLNINGSLNIIIDEKKEIVCDKSSLYDKNVYSSIIGEAFSSNPVIACLLQSCEYEIVEDNLNIFASNEFTYSLLRSKGAEGILRRYFMHNLSLDYKISIQNSSVDLSNYEIAKETEDKNLITQHLNDIRLQNANTISKETSTKELKESTSSIIYGKRVQGDETDISSISEESGIVVVSGEVFKIDTRETKSGKYIYTFAITDYTSSIYVKLFLKPDAYEELSSKITVGSFLRVRGEVVNDKYNKELVIMAFGIEEYTPIKRSDMSSEKRVELHLHTQMSSMDGVSTASDLIKRAKEWGHKAVAITDHGVVQAFPEAMESGKKNNIKVIYGVEAYLVDDGEPIVIGDHNQSLDDEFVVFDIETTGLNKNLDEIIEIGAVKIKNGKVADRFSSLIKPGRKIPEEIVKLTGINDDMVKDMPPIQNVLEDFIKFIGSSPVVAHNAKFDTGFIKVNAKRLNIEFKNSVLDTLTLSRWLLSDLKKHKLNIITDYLGIKLDNHHRAVDDAEATALIFLRFVEMLKKRGANDLKDIDKLYIGNFDIKKADTYHLIILVKSHEGLYNLYKLISMSHINYYHKRPRIPKSLLLQYRDGLIIGGACEAGQIFKGALNGLSDDEFSNIINLYDYLEVQPIGNNRFLIDNGTVENEDKLRELNKRIISLGKRYNKPVVATCDVHFLDPHEEYYRRILMAGQGFSDADKQAPLYLRTTDEMLEEFMYLGRDKAFEIVVTNTNRIADQIETIKPIPDETFPPKIEGAEEEVRKMTLNRAHEIYGEDLPEVVQKRLDKELSSIINNGYAVLYLIAHKLVAKSLEDGYLVGSRGSVGSSFVATMCRITEVNPLAPHYVCPKCKNSEFFTDGSIGSGVDLPEKNCPFCGEMYHRDGFDIPFETFLGFEGDKEPDIDLNFSGEYQAVAHKYTEELFGEGHTFRAGTIGTIAEKTAYGYVKNYLDERKFNVSQAEIDRLVKGCTGVKRTSGQHPGGIMVVPRDNEIYEFTPVQRPADDPNSDIITTHFDYHSISGRLLKLDILGHDDPTVLRMLQNITGLDPTKIPISDSKVLKLFTSTESLGITREDINCEVGTLGIPEFGTKFVRQMLIETQPKTFTDLVRISGLSHGTDVWINNAQDLIKNGTVTLKEVIPTRDDIMVYLMYKGLKPKSAFNIMERVRKGKGLRDEDIAEMKECDVPQWYIDSCNKIKYMFPKGHAVAYVMSALRIAYTKVYYPEAFYSTYFTVRADDFDADLIVKGTKVIETKMKEIENQGNNASQKDKGLMTILEIALEMYKRGFKFRHVSLYESEATNFLITPDGILPPFRALQGVGDNAAKNIVSARKDGVFLSKEDLQTRSKASKTVIEILENHGCLKDLPETNQLSLF